jgi:hypothetical protein
VLCSATVAQGSASAAEREASTTGSADARCTTSAPCDLETALEASAAHLARSNRTGGNRFVDRHARAGRVACHATVTVGVGARTIASDL